MPIMIKLHLPPGAADLAAVEKLPGLQGVVLDSKFGVVPVSPKDDLYVVRTDRVDNLEQRRKLSPEILETYGDIKISTT